ncbi:glycosyltransferase family 2 protein [Mannheimia indoligenes]|uniref:glycosyltransferase family 2 protein n=1 Tax=Mannheimia indoligenes TaxID=3103145 RepID=UPI002FE67929
MITSTIGRSELEEAIVSVRNQTYPVKHYIFIDGKDYWQASEKIIAKYPDVIPIYLPINTGKGGWYNSRINAIAPFIVEEDIICFLDDDNFYESNHIETLADAFQSSSSDWVYSFRNMVRMDGSFLCKDTVDSIGFYGCEHPEFAHFEFEELSFPIKLAFEPFVDINCYAFRRKVAQNLATTWNIQGFGNDRVVFNTLKKELNLKSVGTENFTVNYRMNPKTFGLGKIWEVFSSVYFTEDKIEEAFYIALKSIIGSGDKLIRP